MFLGIHVKNYKTYNPRRCIRSSQRYQTYKFYRINVIKLYTTKKMYKITQYTKDQAVKLGVTVKPSINPSKKLDVFKNGIKVASCGGIGYNDYPTYMEKYGKQYANERRRLYKIRHQTDRTVKGSPGYYADKLLW